MSGIKICLFDAVGVLTIPKEFFTDTYAKIKGLYLEPYIFSQVTSVISS